MYKNLSLGNIANRFNIDLTLLEGKFVVPVGEIAEKLGLSIKLSSIYFNDQITIYISRNPV